MNDITHIHRTIYQSGRSALRDLDSVRAYGIQGVLRLDHHVPTPGIPPNWPDDMATLHLPFDDGEPIPPQIIPRATAFIHEHVAAERGVLVHCQMGISRSTAMVMAYLIEYEALTLEDAYRLIYARRHVVYPHADLLYSLVLYYALPHRWEDIHEPGYVHSLQNSPRT
ncbi:MAG: dual specificity protein phosphatase family protein [Anaerolineales bacterium]